MKSSFLPECSYTSFVGLQIFDYAQSFNGKGYIFLQISQDSNGMFPIECLNSLAAFLGVGPKFSSLHSRIFGTFGIFWYNSKWYTVWHLKCNSFCLFFGGYFPLPHSLGHPWQKQVKANPSPLTNTHHINIHKYLPGHVKVSLMC